MINLITAFYFFAFLGCNSNVATNNYITQIQEVCKIHIDHKVASLDNVNLDLRLLNDISHIYDNERVIDSFYYANTSEPLSSDVLVLKNSVFDVPIKLSYPVFQTCKQIFKNSNHIQLDSSLLPSKGGKLMVQLSKPIIDLNTGNFLIRQVITTINGGGSSLLYYYQKHGSEWEISTYEQILF